MPLLISFDKYVEGRAYQGMTQLAVRPGTPVLNEAVALTVTGDTGQPSQRFAYAEYSVDDGPTTTRLVLEHPDEAYAASLFDSPGYLYKANAQSRFEYVGEDQSEYADQFKQINSRGDGTLQPVIHLLRWVDTASDEEFAVDLDQWVDVESFAEYVATQNLLSNFDDMAGPGQNYYLWYDLGTKKFTVVSWDLNMAMTGDTAAGPRDPMTMGGPGNGEPPAGGDGRGPSMGNPLKTRFLESDAFTGLYEQTYWRLYDEIYGSGLAARTLDRIQQTFPVSEEVDQTTLDEAADTLRTWIEQRTTALGEQRPA